MRSTIPVNQPSYGGFIDRFSGLLLDGIIVGLAQLPVLVLFYAMLFMAGSFMSSGADCRWDPSGPVSFEQQSERCASSGAWIVLAIFAITTLLYFWVWWRLVPGRMSRLGASVGMSIAKLEIESSGGGMVGRWQAFGRALLAILLPFVLVLPPMFIMLAIVGTDASDTSAAGPVLFAVVCLAVIGYALPWLWSLWDRRRQTLYDKFSATVVTGPPGRYDPFAVAAMACGLLASFGVVPLAPLAIIFGHLGVERVRTSRGELKGRGPARVGQIYGYIVTVAVLVGVFVYWLGTR